MLSGYVLTTIQVKMTANTLNAVILAALAAALHQRANGLTL